GGGVVIAVHVNDIVVHSVVIDDDAPPSLSPANGLVEVQREVVMEGNVPLHDEHHGVGGLGVQRTGQEVPWIRRREEEDFMAHVSGGNVVVVNGLDAAGVVELPVHKHQSHGASLNF